jgi:hypothetical protein
MLLRDVPRREAQGDYEVAPGSDLGEPRPRKRDGLPSMELVQVSSRPRRSDLQLLIARRKGLGDAALQPLVDVATTRRNREQLADGGFEEPIQRSLTSNTGRRCGSRLYADAWPSPSVHLRAELGVRQPRMGS